MEGEEEARSWRPRALDVARLWASRCVARLLKALLHHLKEPLELILVQANECWIVDWAAIRGNELAPAVLRGR